MNQERLLELARKINAAHQGALAGVRETLSGAIEAGKLLIEVQDALEPGKWIAWAQENLEFGVRTAQRYKRLASHAALLGENASSLSHYGVVEALEFLADAADADFDEEDGEEESAAVIAELEEDALSREKDREKKESEQDEARKFTRKCKTLANLARYFRAIGQERMAELLEMALEEKQKAEEVAAAVG